MLKYDLIAWQRRSGRQWSELYTSFFFVVEDLRVCNIRFSLLKSKWFFSSLDLLKIFRFMEIYIHQIIQMNNIIMVMNKENLRIL